MNIKMQHDALYPGYAVPVFKAGDIRKTSQGKQVYTGHGWIDCDGRRLLTMDYPQLFEVLRYIFGGEGGTFKLPDLRENGSQVHPESALPSRRVPPCTNTMSVVVAPMERPEHPEMRWKPEQAEIYAYDAAKAAAQGDAAQMVRDLVALWDGPTVQADDYNAAMLAIEDRMRKFAKHGDA